MLQLHSNRTHPQIRLHLMRQTENINVRTIEPLIAPAALKLELPLSEAAAETVAESREIVKRILAGDDPRLAVVVGPCSIHDEKAGLEYAVRLGGTCRPCAGSAVFADAGLFRKATHYRRLEGVD